MRTQRGITLIALIITIVVLIILATVSINAVVGENGLIKKTQDSANFQKMEEERERLELIKPEVAIENDGKISVDNYIKKLIEKGITEEEYVETNEDGSKQITTDTGYSVNIKQDEEYNIVITINGKAVQKANGILEFSNLKWNNGQAEVTIIKNTNDNLKIKYKVLDKDLNVIKDYQEIASGEKITGLNLGEIVKASLWDGISTGLPISLTISDTSAPSTPIITAKTSDNNNYTGGAWTNKNVTITVSSSDSESGVKQIEYSYDNKTWMTDWDTNITNNNIATINKTWNKNTNSVIYTRVVDYVGNVSDSSKINIKIDKTPPTISSVQISNPGFDFTARITSYDSGR